MGKTLAQRQALQALRALALAVDQVKLLSVNLPRELVDVCRILKQRQLRAAKVGIGDKVGAALHIVHVRLHIGSVECDVVIHIRTQRERRDVAVHILRLQGEAHRLQRALLDGHGARCVCSFGLQHHVPSQQRVVVVHLELRTVLELRHAHRIDVGVPALHCTAVANVGKGALLLDIEGVAHRNH